MRAIKSFLLGFFGMGLGLVFLILFLGGIILGFGTRITNKALSPTPHDIPVLYQGNGNNLEKEIESIISLYQPGNTTVFENDLDRLFASIFQDMELSPEIQFHGTAIKLFPNRAIFHIGFDYYPRDIPLIPEKPVPLLLRGEFGFTQFDNSLEIEIIDLSMGQLSLSLNMVDRFNNWFGAIPALGTTADSTLAFQISLKDIEEAFDNTFFIEYLEVQESRAIFRLIPNLRRAQ